MQSWENNRFFSLIKEERYAKEDAFDWLRGSLVTVSTALTCLAIAHSEAYTGINHNTAFISEQVAYCGLWAGIGSVALTGYNAVRYFAIADKVQGEQAKQFVPIMQSELGRELQVMEDLILSTEHPEDPTEGLE